MFQKLDIFEKRYEELNNKLYDPAVATNAELYNDIMKEVKSLEPIVEKYREYKTAVQTLEDAKQIIAEGTDDEFKAMLDEEIARALLIGDGRLSSSDDKINELNIRPIAFDDDLYTIKAYVNISSTATDDQKAKTFIRSAIKARKGYKGSGEPTLYTTEDILTDCLLLEDATGRIIYDSVSKLAATLRVKEIVTVPVMEGVKGKNGGDLLGIIANLSDYNVGADKGGAVNMFDDFDIDYNQYKYLIECRMSGALVKPYSAITLLLNQAS